VRETEREGVCAPRSRNFENAVAPPSRLLYDGVTEKGVAVHRWKAEEDGTGRGGGSGLGSEQRRDRRRAIRGR